MSIVKSMITEYSRMPDIFPKSWKTELSNTGGTTDKVIFDSLQHFIYTASKVTQKQDNMCSMSYATALDMLIKKKSDFPETAQESIRNKVRSELLKRGLITEEVYENFKYTTDGTNMGVDVGKYAAGDAECVLTPSKQYIDFFYELYISVSYNCNVSNETVRENVAKLLATVEELERKHIFIKINTVLPIVACKNDGGNFFSSIPIFSHKEPKNVEVMSSVINDRLLRKFYFAVLEDFYGKDLTGGYGRAISLQKTINIGEYLDEIALFEDIQEKVGA